MAKPPLASRSGPASTEPGRITLHLETRAFYLPGWTTLPNLLSTLLVLPAYQGTIVTRTRRGKLARLRKIGVFRF